MAWRDKIATESGRRQADYAWTVLARALSWGFNRGLVVANPCERGGRLYRGSRAERIWTDADEAAFLKRPPHTCTCHFCSHFGPDSGKAISCACLGRPTTARYRPAAMPKTFSDALISVDVAALVADARSRSESSTALLIASDGQPWTSDGFRAIVGQSLQGRWRCRGYIS